MLRDKKICIFSSSSNEIAKIFFDEARKISFLLAKAKAILVFGGGNNGLMGECARAFKEEKAKIISIIPEKLANEGFLYAPSDKVIKTKTMSIRKSKMESISQGFVALPGGFGTLEEILEMITLKQLGYHNKPIAILNTVGFYDKLLQQIELLYTEKFARSNCRELYFISQNSQEIFDYLNNYIFNHHSSYY